MNWQTFGHQNTKRILELQLKARVFPHAYFFLGAEALGKKMLAYEFSKKILNSPEVSNHSDFQFFDAKDSDIEKVRFFLEKLSFKPFLGNYKVAVVDNAESLNTQSQNAILKTLEEPSSSTIIFLISSRPLLSTISSRCQVFKFNRLSQRQMLSFAKEKALNVTEEKLSKSFGLPGKLVNMESAEESFSWQAVKAMPKAQRLLQLLDLSDKETEELKRLLEDLFKQEVVGLRMAPQNFKLVLALKEAFQSLDKNLNKKLILQKLALSF